MHAQLKMIDHAPSVQMQDAPGSILYSLKNENGEDKENLEELGDSNPALNDIRNSELELEERRAVAENEFYDGDRDQDGESDDIKDTTKDKLEQISTQRNTSSASDNRASSTYHHAHPSLIPPPAPITSGNGNSTNNSINSVANTGNNALDTSSSSSHLPSNSTGSTISSNQLKDQK